MGCSFYAIPYHTIPGHAMPQWILYFFVESLSFSNMVKRMGFREIFRICVCDCFMLLKLGVVEAYTLGMFLIMRVNPTYDFKLAIIRIGVLKLTYMYHQ